MTIGTRGALTALVLAGFALGCDVPEEGRTLTLRYGNEEFRVTYDETENGPIMREGAAPRLVELLGHPEAGYAPDPRTKDLLWLYTSVKERQELARTLRGRPRKT